MSEPAVWYAIPTARDNGGTVKDWKAAGYMTALYVDPGKPIPPCDLYIQDDYEGYPKAVNRLCHTILGLYPETKVVVTGGDDMRPDQNHHPLDIQRQFVDHFPDLFGVMQPTGDRWMMDSNGRSAAERICGSPWMGANFIRRMYGGRGPICEHYFHFFEDEELYEVAVKLNVLWQRPDLTQHHDHWLRSPDENGNRRKRPSFLSDAKLNWTQAQKLFRARKAAGFPGHEPLPVEVEVVA